MVYLRITLKQKNYVYFAVLKWCINHINIISISLKGSDKNIIFKGRPKQYMYYIAHQSVFGERFSVFWLLLLSTPDASIMNNIQTIDYVQS